MHKGFNLGLACFLAVIQASAQINYVSNDNQTGDWLDNNSWIDVAAWANQNPSQPTNSNANSIDVYGYITRQGNLNVTNANPVITVRDTLVISGNTLLGSGASLNVPAGGLLIITGDLTTQGSFALGNSGRVVVGGNVSVTNGSITNNQDFYALGTTSVSGGGNVDGCEPWETCDPAATLGDVDDLRNNDPSLETFFQTLGVLPVEYVSFTAQGELQGITLSWATASELNNDYFEIQRSTNGTDFRTIGHVAGHGTSYQATQYSFTDTSPVDGVNYYRLKQYDFDGAFEYSPLIREFFNLKPVDLKFFPNPASGRLNIVFDPRFLNTNVQVKLYDSKGIVAMEQEVTPTSLTSIIDLNGLDDPGIYMLHVSNHAFEEANPVLVTR